MRKPWFVLGVVAACGGTAGPDESLVPAEPVTVVIDDAGGEVVAPDGLGATLRLEVPAGALSRPTSITVVPLDPEDGVARFAVLPAGLVPSAPITATLEVDGGVPAGLGLRWEDAEGTTPVATDADGGALRATLPSLGFRVSAPLGARRTIADAVDGAVLATAPVDCARQIEDQTLALGQAVERGDVDAMVREMTALEATRVTCVEQDLTAGHA